MYKNLGSSCGTNTYLVCANRIHEIVKISVKAWAFVTRTYCVSYEDRYMMFTTAFAYSPLYSTPRRRTSEESTSGRRYCHGTSPVLVSSSPSPKHPQTPSPDFSTVSSSSTPDGIGRSDQLLLQLHTAVHRQDFSQAAVLRDEIERIRLHNLANCAKPRFSVGVVVSCLASTGKDDRFRAIVLCVSTEHSVRNVAGAPEVWYRCAVDVQDRARLGLRGGNVLLLREDDMTPVPAGVSDMNVTGVDHPVVGVVFRSDCTVSEDGFQFYVRRANW